MANLIVRNNIENLCDETINSPGTESESSKGIEINLSDMLNHTDLINELCDYVK